MTGSEIIGKLINLVFKELKVPYQASTCSHHFLYKKTIFSLNFQTITQAKPDGLNCFWVDKLIPYYPGSAGVYWVRNSMNFYLADPNCFKQAASWIKRHARVKRIKISTKTKRPQVSYPGAFMTTNGSDRIHSILAPTKYPSAKAPDYKSYHKTHQES
jgi:hypothetical protein